MEMNKYNNPLDSYLIPQVSSQSSIEEIIEEKNHLIEEYKSIIESITHQQKEDLNQYNISISQYKRKADMLQQQCDAINSGELWQLLQFYENEIIKINQFNKKNAESLKLQMSLITTTPPDQSKLKKVISTLMVENSALKESNENLWKISRMNEAYKLMARQYGVKIEEKEKVFSAYEKEQCMTVTSLTNDNKILKEQLTEDKKTIKQLVNTIELIKSHRKDHTRKSFSPNTTINSQNTRRFLTEYEDKQTEVQLDNIKLDKCLNGSKMVIMEKTESAKKSLEKVISRVNKENSAYKAIYKKEVTNVMNCLELIIKECIILIKKANSSYNAFQLSRNLMIEMITEYDMKMKAKNNMMTNYISNTTRSNSLQKDYNEQITNSIELARKYLNTFE